MHGTGLVSSLRHTHGRPRVDGTLLPLHAGWRPRSSWLALWVYRMDLKCQCSPSSSHVQCPEPTPAVGLLPPWGGCWV